MIVLQAAFRDNTVGLPKFCLPETVPVIDRDMLLTYRKHHHTPDRMVLAGVGIDHQTLVELAHKYFVQTTPVWEEGTFKLDRSKGRDVSIAQYTGGQVQVELLPNCIYMYTLVFLIKEYRINQHVCTFSYVWNIEKCMYIQFASFHRNF